LINSEGKDIVHKELITRVLKSLMKPEEIAVVLIPRHEKGHNVEAQGNRVAFEAAKEAA
jgi:hypothetical protein